jgi:hypothetical protein
VSTSFDLGQKLLVRGARRQMNSGYAVIGFAEALSSPEVAWSLVDADFTVAAFSRKGRKSALQQSRYVTVFEIAAPETDSDRAAIDLANLLRDCRSDELCYTAASADVLASVRRT